MVTNGQQKLNRKDVRKATINFIISFMVLSGVTFMAVFHFFKSAQLQTKQTRQKIEEYNALLSTNTKLEGLLDGIYNKMYALNTENIDNEVNLRKSIADDIEIAQRLVGKDSADNLMPYAVLIKNFRPIMAYKLDLSKLRQQEENSRNNVEACSGKIARVNDVARQQQQMQQQQQKPAEKKKGRFSAQ